MFTDTGFLSNWKQGSYLHLIFWNLIQIRHSLQYLCNLQETKTSPYTWITLHSSPFSPQSVRFLEGLQGWALKTQKVGLSNSRKKWEDSACEETGCLECHSQKMLRKGELPPSLATLCELPGWIRGIAIGFRFPFNPQFLKRDASQAARFDIHSHLSLEKVIWKIYSTNNKEM